MSQVACGMIGLECAVPARPSLQWRALQSAIPEQDVHRQTYQDGCLHVHRMSSGGPMDHVSAHDQQQFTAFCSSSSVSSMHPLMLGCDESGVHAPLVSWRAAAPEDT